MNKTVRKKYIICFSIIAAILVLDQVVKIWVKTHLAIGEGFNLIGDWSRIYFVENEGIAFGISFGENFGKLFLSLFRLLASMAILYYLIKKIKTNSRMLLLVSISLIFVGAIGNLVDSCLYGLIFNESTHTQVATLFPEGGGYDKFLYGRVVDMLYFPIAEWTWPEWMPWFGGKHAEFFNAIFNVADSAVTTGVLLLIIDQFKHDKKEKREEETKESKTEGESNESTDVVSSEVGKDESEEVLEKVPISE